MVSDYTTRLGLARLDPTHKYRSFVYLDLHSYYSVHTEIQCIQLSFQSLTLIDIYRVRIY